MSLSPIKRVQRIIQRRRTGDPQDPDDIIAVVDAIAAAVENRNSIEYNLGLRTGWRHFLLAEGFFDALKDLGRGSNRRGRPFCKEIFDDLTTYKRTSYKKNLLNEHFPEGREGSLHKVLLKYRGCVPTEEALRRQFRMCGENSMKTVPTARGIKAA